MKTPTPGRSRHAIRAPFAPKRLFATVLLLAFEAAIGAVAVGAEQGLKVMSLNIAQDTGTPSASNSNAWNYTAGPPRRDRAVRVIADQAADIVGLQEVETNQLANLTTTNALSAFAWYGAGRTDGQSLGQHEVILYRASRFVRQGAGVFWLSLTPDTPGSLYPGAGQVRIAIWARLLDLWSGRTLLVMSTHLDVTSSAARQYSAQLIRERIGILASNAHTIVTGDFNMYPNEAAYPILRGTADTNSLQLLDSLRAVIPAEGTNELTRHNFAGGTTGRRVDYIFFTGEFSASTAAIVRVTYDNGRFPSDHYPVTADFRLEPVVPQFLGAEQGAGGLVLTAASVSGLTYRILSSTNLQGWQDLVPPSTWLATGSVLRSALQPPEDAASLFYRVVIRPE